MSDLYQPILLHASFVQQLLRDASAGADALRREGSGETADRLERAATLLGRAHDNAREAARP